MHNIKEREREREVLFLTFYDINPRIMCKLQPGKKHVAGSREGGGGVKIVHRHVAGIVGFFSLQIQDYKLSNSIDH